MSKSITNEMKDRAIHKTFKLEDQLDTKNHDFSELFKKLKEILY